MFSFQTGAGHVLRAAADRGTKGRGGGVLKCHQRRGLSSQPRSLGSLVRPVSKTAMSSESTCGAGRLRRTLGFGALVLFAHHELSEVHALAMGSGHTCVLLDDGSMKVMDEMRT